MASFIGPAPAATTVRIPFRTSREHKVEDEIIAYKEVSVGGGDSVYTVYAPCGAAGSAMYDVESRQFKVGPAEDVGVVTYPHCWLMYAPPIIIHGDYMSVEQGMRHVNMVHRTSNFTPPITTNAELSTLGNIG